MPPDLFKTPSFTPMDLTDLAVYALFVAVAAAAVWTIERRR